MKLPLYKAIDVRQPGASSIPQLSHKLRISIHHEL